MEGLREDQRGGAAQGGDVVGGAQDDADGAARVVEGLLPGRLLHGGPERLARPGRVTDPGQPAAGAGAGRLPASAPVPSTAW